MSKGFLFTDFGRKKALLVSSWHISLRFFFIDQYLLLNSFSCLGFQQFKLLCSKTKQWCGRRRTNQSLVTALLGVCNGERTPRPTKHRAFSVTLLLFTAAFRKGLAAVCLLRLTSLHTGSICTHCREIALYACIHYVRVLLLVNPAPIHNIHPRLFASSVLCYSRDGTRTRTNNSTSAHPQANIPYSC